VETTVENVLSENHWYDWNPNGALKVIELSPWQIVVPAIAPLQLVFTSTYA
jgi:hypothetical protein